MTVSTTIVKNSYNGDSTTATFNFTFKVLANTELKVIIRSANATETIKTLNTHYSITGIGNANGGSITFTAGNIPSSTEQVVLIRETAQTQNIDYLSNDPFPAETHEEGLDKSIIITQELQEQINRSIKLSRTNTINSTEFSIGAADRAGKILGFDANGELVVSQELGSYAGVWIAATTYAARDIVKDTSNNNIYLCNTGHTASGTTPISSNADVAKWDLLVDAYSATASAAAASASASAAATSESNAATSESNASTSAGNAATSESNASASATAAANSYDSFDDRYLGAKASNPTLDNDSNALIDGALYFDTTLNVMKVYDLGTTSWKRTTPTSSEQSAIDTVSGISADVTTVAGISGNVTTVAGNNANITAVAGNASNINTVAGNNANITTVAGQNANITTLVGISADITTVASNNANITTVATDIAKIITTANDLNEAVSEIDTVANAIANVDLVGTNIANVNSVGGSIASVNTVATNIADVNSFANTYRIAASAPVTSLDVGDLYFDTTANELKVYKASGWSAAGSTVNGTSARFTYNITGTPSSVSGSDANGNTLAYDAGFADVYVNGVRMSSSDITITSGTSVVFASALADGDVVDVVAYGTFNVAAIDASNITSGSLNIARIADGSITNAKLATPFVLTNPTISSIAPDTITNASTNIVITGTNFVITPTVEFHSTTGAVYYPNTVTRNSSTQLTVNATLAVDGTYFIRVENPDGLAVRSSTALLTVSDAPTWTTASGSLGSVAQGASFSTTVVATSDSAITYSVQSGALPTGITLNTSTGVISGTESGVDTGETVYNFTLRATDAETQTADRAFTITVTVGINNAGQFN